MSGTVCSDHPEYVQEAGFLRQTVQAVAQALQAHEAQYFEGGGNNYTNRVLNSGLREDILNQLRDHGHEPYFARLDYRDSRGEQSVYFGHAHLALRHGMILDWRCDLYSLYLGGNAVRQSYRVQSTGRRHDVDLLLKRRLEIRDQELQAVSDTVDYRRMAASARPGGLARVEPETGPRRAPERPHTEDAYLIRKLQARGDAKLQDIVATIQAEQDAIIRAPLQDTLLLHGVAGSGKTSIAFHRLAYLMFSEHEFNLQPQQVLVIGPNRTFLSYVSHLLPSLGVTGIAQRTFQDWTWERMQRANPGLPEVTFRDAVADSLDDAGGREEARRRLWQSARLRGSAAFGALIARHAAHLGAHPPLPKETFSGRVGHSESPETFVLSPADFRTLWAEVTSDIPLAERRDRFISAATAHLNAWFDETLGPAQSKEDIDELRRLRRGLGDHIRRGWKKPDLFTAYEQMFQPGHLPALARDLFTLEEQRILRATRPATSKPVRASRTGSKGQPDEPVAVQVDLSDLAGLSLLHHHLFGAPGGTYRHVVVDEAQDFSPLHLELLVQVCPSRSMTVVGDTAQSIHAYRGVQDWSEFGHVLGERRDAHLIRQNYRSTREIVNFCNALQRQVCGDRTLASLPMARTGPQPRLVLLPDGAGQVRQLASEIRMALERGSSSVAVLTRNRQSARDTAKALEMLGLRLHLVTSDAEVSPEQLGSVVVMPAALSKGLEFAAVLVPDADQDHYPAQEQYAGHLLYVAASRALHELTLLAVGRPSEWLEGALPAATLDDHQLERPLISWGGATFVARVRELRQSGRPFRDIQPDVEARVATLLRAGHLEELVEAYTAFGQLGRPSLEALLLMLASQNPEAFIRRAFDARVPEAVRDQVGEAIDRLQGAGHPKATVYQQWLDYFVTGVAQSPAAQAAASTVPASRTPAGLATVTALKNQLQGRTAQLPKATRKVIRQVESDVLLRVPQELRELVRYALLFNLFDARTLQALRSAYESVAKTRLEFPPLC